MRLTAARLAREIEDDIVARGWPLGEVIGSEEQLLARYGVGRNVLREAVRILETHGVARRRQGPGGGLVVVEPQADSIVESARLFLNFRRTRLHHLYDAWIALESLALREVAGRLDEGQIDRLRAVLARVEQWDEQTSARTAGRPNVHTEIAALTGNPMLELCLQTLLTISTAAGVRRMPADAAARLRAADTALVELLATGDAEGAQAQFLELVQMLVAYNEAGGRSVGPDFGSG